MIAFLMQTAALFLVLYFMPWFGNVVDEARLALAASLAFIMSGAILFLLDFLRAPAVIWRRDQEEIGRLRQRLVPSLRLFFEEKLCLVDIPYNGSEQMVGGKRWAVISGHDRLFRIGCVNTSAKPINDCETLLIGVEEIHQDGPGGNIAFNRPMRLVWAPRVIKDEVKITIQGVTPYFVSVIRQRGPRGKPELMSPDRMLDEMLVFDTAKKYRLTIQVGRSNVVAHNIEFDIYWDESGGMVKSESCWEYGCRGPASSGSGRGRRRPRSRGRVPA